MKNLSNHSVTEILIDENLKADEFMLVSVGPEWISHFKDINIKFVDASAPGKEE